MLSFILKIPWTWSALFHKESCHNKGKQTYIVRKGRYKVPIPVTILGIISFYLL
jgi:hypothetical protein